MYVYTYICIHKWTYKFMIKKNIDLDEARAEDLALEARDGIHQVEVPVRATLDVHFRNVHLPEKAREIDVCAQQKTPFFDTSSPNPR